RRLSALVAEAGHRTLLAERAPEPAFKIGESLMPATYWTLKRLGVLERMRASHFPAKRSVQFFTKSGKATAPFYFFENDPHESSQTWQVKRSEFDQLLLDNAREKGAEIRRGATVSRLLWQGEKALGVAIAPAEGEPYEVAAKVVVDASGQSSVVARALGLHQSEPTLRQVSFFTHFEGAQRDPGIDEGATLILHTRDQKSWFWYIPLPENVVSVGVVGSVDHLVAGREADPQRVFEEELAACEVLQPRLAGARQVQPMRVLRDFSYRARRIAGDGWLLVGDAFGFIDPIYSSGVFLALRSGELAADAINQGFARNDFSAAQLGCFGEEFAAGVEALRKLVYAFYHPEFSFARFLKRYPQYRPHIINLLIGNVDRPLEGLFDAMGEMIPLPASAPFEAPLAVGR
ncbi:MAG TPA: NAD(P)/FAD-dependent oxidoreductase, partial [Thermoanaerobaculia bacterium]|nr:NAD(P)/FAD-dependent oxidoreductase [Thermoanaerobaculia bacterium]